jgi:hypothetical protein
LNATDYFSSLDTQPSHLRRHAGLLTLIAITGLLLRRRFIVIIAIITLSPLLRQRCLNIDYCHYDAFSHYARLSLRHCHCFHYAIITPFSLMPHYAAGITLIILLIADTGH